MSIIEWLGARLTKLSFSGDFPVPEFFNVLFNLVVRHFPVFLFAISFCYFCSFKKKKKKQAKEYRADVLILN